jgi:hypothetical protein
MENAIVNESREGERQEREGFEFGMFGSTYGAARIDFGHA